MLPFVEGRRGTIEGSIAAIRYQNARDGFVVADIACDDGRSIAAVGTIAGAEEGAPVTLMGEVVRDERFGIQFAVESTVDPELDEEAARNYLASGLVPYIGPGTATQIVERFGTGTLLVLATEPELLTEFRGITAKRLPAIKRGLRETLHLAAVVGLLRPMKVEPGERRPSFTVCKRIHRRYGARAGELIRANPWRLAKEIAGIAFTSADAIAKRLGRSFDAPERIEAAVLQALRNAAAEEGHIVLSQVSLRTAAGVLCAAANDDIDAAIERLVANEELHAEKRGYALPSLARAEQVVATKVKLISSFADAEPLRVTDEEIARIEAGEGITFDDSQKRAIAGALADRMTVITGNPGTGKTTIVRAILDVAEGRGLKVALASPTGRAAKRLSEATGRPAKTIHRFLRYHPDHGFRGPEELPDLLVVDEVSMLDSPLAARLLSALPPYVRLLLVGDADQLPAVGPGNVLGDLMASSLVTVFRLRQIHRTAAGSGVPRLAGEINGGIRTPHFDNRTTRFTARETPDEIAEYLTGIIAEYADRAGEFQVLCPMKKGAAGTQALNRAIQAILNPPVPGAPGLKRDGFDLRPGDRILVTGNDYDNELFNGDVGYLRGIGPDGELTVEFDGATRELPAGAGEGFTLAYAMTVHKAQGSEFPIVLLPMHTSLLGPPSSPLLSRRLLYTAVSRASKTVALVGQAKAISIAVGRHDPLSRQTLLRGYVSDLENPAPVVENLADEDDEDF